MTEDDTFAALKYRRVAGAHHLHLPAGTIYWVNDREQIHRIGKPAVEYPNGTNYWYLNGKLHREDGPAAEYANRAKEWYLNGKLHREDGPAIIRADGTKYWFLEGTPWYAHSCAIMIPG